MDVAITELRANLRTWLDRARSGDEIVVTERGVPVARLIPVDAGGLIDRLEKDGLISRPKTSARPTATSRRRIVATAPVSDLVAELRR